MEQERWRQVEELFPRALEREEGQRAEFLAAACAGDELLRGEVESLLASAGMSGSFAEAPALELMAAYWLRRRAGRRKASHRMLMDSWHYHCPLPRRERMPSTV